jgi:restriction system protein
MGWLGVRRHPIGRHVSSRWPFNISELVSKKSSLFDDLFFIASKLPWWVSVVIAVGGYAWLHSVATAPTPVFADVKHLDSMVFHTAARTFAGFGQYLLPVIFLAGALASVLGRRKRRNLLASMTMPGGKTMANIWS